MSLLRRIARGTLMILGVLFVLGGVGALLPREHVAMEIVELKAPPAAVYAALRGFEEAPTWRSGLQRVEILPKQGDRLRYREFGGEGPMTFEVLQDVPDQRLVVQIADIHLAFGGRWVFQLAPTEGGGTRLSLAEVGDIPNPLIRFFAHYIFGFHGTIEQYVADLQAHLAKTT